MGWGGWWGAGLWRGRPRGGGGGPHPGGGRVVPGRRGRVGPPRPGAPAVGFARRPAGMVGSPVARPATRPLQGQKLAKGKVTVRPAGPRAPRPAGTGGGEARP